MALVCPPDAVNAISGEPINEIDKSRIVKLKPAAAVECYDFPSIYALQRSAVTSDTEFISPLTRAPYREPDMQAIETARLLYVRNNPAEARNYPSLLNIVEGERSLADAFGAIMGIATGSADARPRLERILARGVVTPYTSDRSGKTLLYEVINRGVEDLIPRFMTPEGFKIESNGYTPLLLACSTGNLAVIRAVAPEPGDAATAVDSDGNNALLMAAGVWSRAAKEQSVATLTFLIDRYGYDLNVRNNESVTPLLAALAANNSAAAQLLINRGADVNALDSSRSSPLIYAAANGDPQIVKLLLERGAKMLPNAKHETAFGVAQERATAAKQNPLSKNTASRDAVVALLRSVPLSENAAPPPPADLVQPPVADMGAVRRKARIEHLVRERIDRPRAEAYAAAVNAAIAAGRDPTSVPIPQFIPKVSLAAAANERRRIQEAKWLAQHAKPKGTKRGGRRRAKRKTRKNRHYR